MRLIAKLVLIFSCCVTSLSFASYEGFIEANNGTTLYVNYVSAQPGQPTVVLINGLTYSSRQWDAFAQALVEKGVGVLRYDLQGQGQTLLRSGPILDVLPLQLQVEDSFALLEALQIEKPYNLLGLSYGGAVAMQMAAQNPQDVAKVILQAPFIAPLESQDQWIKSQIWYTRKAFPYNTMTDDELYDYFLRQVVYSLYPSAEPIVLENPYKLEAVYRMVQGARKFLASEIVHALPRGSVHLMVALEDQYMPPEKYEELWSQIPQEAKASRILISQTEHKMPEAIPNFSAAWVYEILSENKLLTHGASFNGSPSEGKAEGDSGVIYLPTGL